MLPILISQNLSSSMTTASSTGGLPGEEIPRDLIISGDSRDQEPAGVRNELEDCDSITSSLENPYSRAEETRQQRSNKKSISGIPCSPGSTKGPFHHLHSHNTPVTSKEVMKTINDGAAPYLSNKQSSGSSTSMIVDQALDVVKSKGASSHFSPNAKKDADASQSSHGTCNTANQSVCTNTTAASSTTGTSSDVPVSPEVSAQQQQQPEPNFIAPSLRKIAKKRRKEPDKNGMERSSFHHTKSSKEYLRKAQEALKQQQELYESSTSSSSAADSLGDKASEHMHSPRTNFRMLSQVNAAAVMITTSDAPFSRSQSCRNVGASEKAQEDSSASNPYGYEDPDATCAASSGQTSDPYGYEDPDCNAARILPFARRMEPARRRGSVTKYSMQAAQAAQKATERIMRLQGLNWKGKNNEETPSTSNAGRSTTPTGRRSHPRHATESRYPTDSCTPQTGGVEQTVMPIPIRRRSIPMDNWVAESTPVVAKSDAMDVSNPYGYEDMAMAGVNALSMKTTEDAPSSNPYGYGDPDAAVSSTNTDSSSSNPYGYGDNDTLPRQPARRHPRARRRGSVTKFSLDAAAQTASSFESENSAPVEEVMPEMLKGSEDFVMALKPPAVGRPFGLAPKNRRRVGVLSTGTDVDQESSGGILQLRRNNSSSSDQGSPHRAAPRRTGSSASARHLARFNAPGRSESFLSQGSTASWEDDADSLAPDMESLCSIHDRGDLGIDFAPVPPVSGLSPITPGITPGNRRSSLTHTFSGKSDTGRMLPEPSRSFSERNGSTVVTFPADSDFAILPFSTSGGDSRSSARMPAPPVRRAPSHSTSGNSTTLQSGQQSTSVSS